MTTSVEDLVGLIERNGHEVPLDVQIALFKPSKYINRVSLDIQFPEGTSKETRNKCRIIAIGDVHGCIDELKELWEKLQVTEHDLVVFLGDLVDRGPDSEAVVQFVQEHSLKYSCTTILGNHDEKCLRYHWHVLRQKADPSYKIPMKVPPSYHKLSESSLRFLARAPHAITLALGGELVLALVHAGIGPWEFRQDPKAFMRNRYFLEKDGKLTPAKSIKVNGVWHIPEGSLPWYHYWRQYKVVYGHIPSKGPRVINNTVGVDGGCVYGGYLRAWVWSGVGRASNVEFFVEVPAKQVYYTEPKDEEE